MGIGVGNVMHERNTLQLRVDQQDFKIKDLEAANILYQFGLWLAAIIMIDQEVKLDHLEICADISRQSTLLSAVDVGSTLLNADPAAGGPFGDWTSDKVTDAGETAVLIQGWTEGCL